MSDPVDLLLITCNRRNYLEKSLANLLADPSSFHLYCWDNASWDGSADIIATLSDSRVAQKRFSKENVGQREPYLWFLKSAKSDILGKVDDDILLPSGWIQRIAPLLRRESRFGLLGCWTFLPGDWDEKIAAHKIIEIGGARIFRNMWIGGTAFLARHQHLIQYITPAGAVYGLPIDQFLMTEEGLINGFPLPLLLAHHMDDPRSPHCLMNLSGDSGAHTSSTALRKRIRSPKRYGEWIAQDARQILLEPLDSQLQRYRLKRDRSVRGQMRRLILKLLGRAVK